MRDISLIPSLTNPVCVDPQPPEPSCEPASVSRLDSGLRRSDFVFAGLLLGLGAFIWLRDPAWQVNASDTLPIIAAVPMFGWLGAPWRFRPGPARPSLVRLTLAAFLLVLGLVLDLTFPLAAGWTLALWAWLEARVAGPPAAWRPLLLLPLMAFPWLTLDLTNLGWHFRLSAAWVIDHLFGVLGYSVVRQGTMLLVRGMPIEVVAACAGMNSLQAMLTGGVVLAALELRGNRWFWAAVASLPVLAWVANTLRVCAIVGAAVTRGHEFAMGWFHETGGWLIVLSAFTVWWFVIRWLGRRPAPAPRTPRA